MSQKGPGENHPDKLPLAAKLYTKMIACYGDTSWIAKSGVNEGQKYKFARAEDMYDQVRKAFAKNGIALRFIPTEVTTTPRGGSNSNSQHTLMKAVIQVIDTETGYRESTPWYGECIETGDKAISKCLTAGLKYFLRTQLMIPTGDDPDAHAPPEAKAPAKKTQPAKFPGSGEYLKSLSLTPDQVAKFKSICESKSCPWGRIALEAKEQGIASYEALIAYVEDGEIPNQESVDSKIGTVAPVAPPSVDWDPFADEVPA